MSRTVMLPDDVCATILKLIHQEVFAGYSNPKEKAKAEEALAAIQGAIWVPECPMVINTLPPAELAALQAYLTGAD